MADKSEGARTERSEPAVFSNIEKILRDPISAENSQWLTTAARTNAFYVRGYSWFSRNVTNIAGFGEADAKPYVSAMMKLVRERSGWKSADLKWSQTYSFRNQAQPALGAGRSQRRPAQFTKAVETIVLCEAYLREPRSNLDIHPDDVYLHMNVQPAIFYLTNFTEAMLEEMLKIEPRTMSLLQEGTNQTNADVFWDMTAKETNAGRKTRMTVTRDLATKTKAVLDDTFNGRGFDIGLVTCRRDAAHGVKASTNEYIEF